MPIINQDTLNKDVASNPYLGKSPEELDAAIADLKTRLARERSQELMGKVSTGLGQVGDVFLQKGELKPPERKESVADSINEFIAKERLKQQIANEAPLSPSEEKAKMELDAIRKDLAGQDTTQPVISLPTDNVAQSVSSKPLIPTATTMTKDNAPSQFIRKSKGKDIYGREQYEDVPNKEYDIWAKKQEKLDELSIDNERKSQFIKDSTQDTLDTIVEIKKGMGNFGLTGTWPSIPGTSRANWEANINKLLSGKIIDIMTKMKEASKTGATGFGQLSNKELGVLQESSTALKKWLSPEDAGRYLKKMEDILQKVMTSSIPSFTTEQEAESSGLKGEVIIGGRRARID